jgi:hypothetical protein
MLRADFQSTFARIPLDYPSVLNMEPMKLVRCDVRFVWAQSQGDKRCATNIDRIIVHRIEVSQEDPTFGDHPAEVIRFFATHPIGQKATGGKMPYPLLVDPSGVITQCLPLGVVSMHARKFNQRSIGVALVGDFRTRAPSAAQRQTLVWLGAHLLHRLQLPVEAVCGHDGLDGGSTDPDKECPGRYLPMASLRADIAAALAVGPMALDFAW